MEVPQILDAIDTGIVVFDRDFKVSYWNRWMSTHSHLDGEAVLGRSLFEHYPSLKNARFLRNCQSVLTFGSSAFFPQDPYCFLFPMKPIGLFCPEFEFMQQSCTIGPIRNEIGEISALFITVRDMSEVAVYEKKLIELTQRDPLTGIFNRRCLNHFIQEELYRFKRYRRPFSVLMIDLDHFKEVNDRFGHLFGDEMLKVVSSSMASSMRRLNHLARYGGEEFCCVLPETDSTGAVVVAEKLRKLIEGLCFFSDRLQVKVTASFGSVTVTENLEDADLILEKADQALYQAKEEGRNRVVSAR